MALPGTQLNNGSYVGAGGQVVMPGLNGGDWVMVNGKWQEYTPPPPEPPKTKASSTSAGPKIPAVTYTPPVSTTALTTSANITPGDSSGNPAALGFDLHERSFDMMLRAEASRQAAIDQSVRIATLITEMERTSPTRAAELAVQLGMPDLQPDLGFTKNFTNGKTMGMFSGQVGTQDVKLPWSFSGRELTFLDQNDTVANIFRDIGERFGLPNLLETSQANLLPTSRGLVSLAGG